MFLEIVGKSSLLKQPAFPQSAFLCQKELTGIFFYVNSRLCGCFESTKFFFLALRWLDGLTYCEPKAAICISKQKGPFCIWKTRVLRQKTIKQNLHYWKEGWEEGSYSQGQALNGRLLPNQAFQHSHFKFDGCFFKVPCIWDTSDIGKKRHLNTNGDKTPRKNATEFRDTVNNSARGRTLCEEDCLTALSFSNAGLSRSNSRETQGNQKHETAIAQLARVATICPGYGKVEYTRFWLAWDSWNCIWFLFSPCWVYSILFEWGETSFCHYDMMSYIDL